jgi:hypothetical protein
MISDLNDKGTFFSLEASRRIANNYKATLEGRWFKDIKTQQLAYSYRRYTSFN